MQPSADQPPYKFGVQVFCVTVVMLVIAGIYFNYINKKFYLLEKQLLLLMLSNLLN